MKLETKIIIGIIICSLGLLVGAVFLLTKPNSPTTPVQADNQLLLGEDSLKISTPSAKLTLVEFSDYICPACDLVQPIINQLLTEYKDQINFAYRHFPLPQHKNAPLAAQVAEAAGEQGKFFAMSDKLFSTQESWADSDNPKEIFLNFAKELNLDLNQFQKALDEQKFAGKIKQGQEDGLKLGINSTPTFYLNNQKYQGTLDYDSLKKAFEEQLKN